ncbi:hypothetical protein Agub_g3531 [Astrephomene gubernaculifera]|uniref:Uncharacterized protein n=1 Tax=Astrephomene gubernaculifera TaxID=47775 RepID=A0AAD3DIS5_9CHLO|nr:hypothetical protein Agub_g3531 [Astrephomene gubernaculifera]
MGSKGWTIATAIAAIIAFAPWAIYLAGLGKLTDVLTHRSFTGALKQVIVMLEWYTVSAQFINLVLIIIACLARSLRRTHSMFVMFLAVNSALIIVRATERISQINLIDDGQDAATVLGVPGTTLAGKPLQYLRAEACGQVASATFNFLLAILIGFAGTVPEEQGQLSYQPPVTV